MNREELLTKIAKLEKQLKTATETKEAAVKTALNKERAAVFEKKVGKMILKSLYPSSYQSNHTNANE